MVSVGAGIGQYRYGLHGRGSIPGKGYISFLHSVHTGYGAPPNLLIGTAGFLARVKRHGREADCKPLSNAEEKNDRAVPQLTPYGF